MNAEVTQMVFCDTMVGSVSRNSSYQRRLCCVVSR